MKQTPATTPHSQVNHLVDPPTSMFVGMALDMSWRLALAVLVPILGGYALDKQFNLSPILTILGFVFALLGMTIVMWQTVLAANKATAPFVAATHERAVAEAGKAHA